MILDLWVNRIFDFSFGCYVLETARRNYGGEYYWLSNEQQPILVAGEPDFSVSIKAWEKIKGYMVLIV